MKIIFVSILFPFVITLNIQTAFSQTANETSAHNQESTEIVEQEALEISEDHALGVTDSVQDNTQGFAEPPLEDMQANELLEMIETQ